MAGLTRCLLIVCISLIPEDTIGAIRCACNTQECQETQETECNAKHQCYVQYSRKTEPVIRGCIDRLSPLLCENHRPSKIAGHWPVLHCCSSDRCNQDILPTLPGWHPEVQVNITSSPKKAVSDDGLDKENLHDRQDSGELKPRHGRLTPSVNPLHVALPVIGGCVLIALTICAVFVVRKRTSVYCKYHKPSVPLEKGRQRRITNEDVSADSRNGGNRQENSESKLIV